MRYVVLVKPELDGRSWSVHVPDLPGCLSCGETRERALVSLQEAAGAWIETAHAAGRSIPAPALGWDDEAIRHAVGEGWQAHTIDIDLPTDSEDDGGRIVLSERDFLRFISSIESPPAVNDRLAQALDRASDGAWRKAEQ